MSLLNVLEPLAISFRDTTEGSSSEWVAAQVVVVVVVVVVDAQVYLPSWTVRYGNTTHLNVVIQELG